MDQTARVRQDLYNSEINCTIASFWDAGFRVLLGDDLHGFVAETRVRTFVDAVQWLANAAVTHYPESAAMTISCTTCDDTGWVCENHLDRPWDGPRACSCGGAGAPCPACNVPAEGEAPPMPEGFRVEIDKDGWRH